MKRGKRETQLSSGSIKEHQSPADFAKENWKEILAITGTLAGAVILLLIRYHKKRRAEEGNPDNNKMLDVLSKEAMVATDETAVLLETGAEVARQIKDAPLIAMELSIGLPDEKVDNTSRKKRKRKNVSNTEGEGGPREIMKLVTKIR